MADKNKDIWFSPNKVFSYDKVLNFVTGAKGCGKTYGCKKWAIKHYIKTGKRFIYLRRTKEELKDLDTFFTKVGNDDELKIHQFIVQGKKFIMDGQEIGRATALTISQAKKGVDYKDYDTIIFDEFIIEDNLHHYLDEEVKKLFLFMDTVFRASEERTRCICLSNSILWANPYFMFYKFKPMEEGIQLSPNGEALLQIYKNQAFREYRKTTRMGKLMEGTDYGDMALDNKFRDVNSDFINTRKKDSVLMINIKWKTKTYGLWYNKFESVYVVSNKFNPNNRTICYSISEFKPNMMLISDRNFYFNKELKRAFKNGFLYYEDIYIRNEMFDLLNLIGVR